MSSSARIDELRQKFDENPRRYFAPLANEYRKVGDLEQAIFICQEYLPQQPGHMSGHIVYGQALFEAKRNDEARAVFETALALDPENLIALRHLGDIAREAGDADGARTWYSRGLDADPRNVEMSTLLGSLPAASPVAQPRDSGAASVHESAHDVNAPTAGARATTDGVSGSWLDDEPTGSAKPVRVADQPTGPALDSHTEPEPPDSESGLIDLEEMAFSEMAFSSSAPTPVIGQPAVPLVGAMATSVELADDVEFTPFDLAGTSTGHASVMGLESHMHSVDATVEEIPHFVDADAVELEEFEPGLPIGDGPPLVDVAVEQSVPATAGAATFVTETMAQLYLSQGHREEALEIYAQLVDQRPDDAALRARFAAAEAPPITPADAHGVESIDAAGVLETGEATEPDSAVDARRPEEAGAPTIRDFLQQLFGGGGFLEASAPIEAPAPESERPGDPESWPAAEDAFQDQSMPMDERSADMGFPIEEGVDVSETEEISAAAPSPVVDEVPMAASAHDGESPIDALFAYAPSTDHDLAAAQLLADAFSPDDAGAGTLHGMPAHRASGELSLDTVFRTDAPARRTETMTTGGFALDQFFSMPTAQPVAGMSEAPPPSAALPEDDVEQFNSWLTGLKKT